MFRPIAIGSLVLVTAFAARARADGLIDRLPPEPMDRLATLFHCAEATRDEPLARQCILAAYDRDAAALLQADLAHLDSLASAGTGTEQGALAAWTADLEADLRPSIKERGRTWRRALTFPAFPFVYAWRKRHSATEYEGPQWVDFAQAQIFAPNPGLEPAALDPGASATLLARYAPLLVQEVDPQARYAAAIDRIGTVRLEATTDGPQPEIDISRPASYAYTDTVTLRGQAFQRLIYTFWYPEHPKLKKGIDVEAGTMEGITLRITLDAAQRPALYETIYNCGCSHRLFVDRRVEEAARAEWGAPQDDQPYAIQRSVEGKIDWIVPELVDSLPGGRPMLFVRAGFHLPAAVRYQWPTEVLQKSPRESYALRAYGELENLPYRDEAGERRASLFTETGLVRGAARLEGALLTPLGLYRAGQPRQRGTQLIHFDQADFDDPALYATYLRLPEPFFASSTRSASEAAAEAVETGIDAEGEQR